MEKKWILLVNGYCFQASHVFVLHFYVFYNCSFGCMLELFFWMYAVLPSINASWHQWQSLSWTFLLRFCVCKYITMLHFYKCTFLKDLFKNILLVYSSTILQYMLINSFSHLAVKNRWISCILSGKIIYLVLATEQPKPGIYN